MGMFGIGDTSPPAQPQQEVTVAPVRMSTVEIAELTGKAHRHVLRDARKMLAELYEGDALKFGPISFEGTYTDAYGREKLASCCRGGKS